MFFEYMKPGEERKVANLVWNVFEEFEAPSYKQEGIDEFKSFILPENIAARCDTGQSFVICCKNSDDIIGVIAVRDNSHISLLFVKKEYHRKGIARKLFNIILEKCYNTDQNLQAITVNSSPYAVAIYEKMGFEKIDFVQEKNGILFIPMKYTMNL
ncbi:GNAT family N-acetyltransferase [Pelosinus sp. IPA-1]|uniref:GNAT family N-acetyltransferase n=1 Tax=Pelosinus sp. IPA-1 TaxID=3029569 RepID=UPI0024362778|nr:GNAT family N-acetyltransferase [Pelosinus sp. IPA-1]GMB01955.1 N-acetyltransferase [Pelosinus sp. IPA-1]